MTEALVGRTLRQPTRERLQVGRGLIMAALAEAHEGFVLVTQPEPLSSLPAWAVTRAGEVVLARSLSRSDLDAAVARGAGKPVVIGIGGGAAMDTAKWVAIAHSTPLILAPSILSVDACVTNTVAVRESGRVHYQGFVEADRILLDFDLVQRAPVRLNRAGIGDLLSIHTALWDWSAMDGVSVRGSAGRRFEPEIAARAQAVLSSVDRVADGLGRGDEEAYHALLLGYADINDMTVACGHAQMEEGSEHYFAYYAERVTRRSFLHGEIVTLGALLMSRLQGNDPDRLVSIADRGGVRWRPGQLGLRPDVLRAVLAGLPAYCAQAGLPGSVLDLRPPGEAEVSRLLEGLF